MLKRPRYLETHELFPRKMISPGVRDLSTVRNALWVAREEYERLADKAVDPEIRKTWKGHSTEARKLIKKCFGE